MRKGLIGWPSIFSKKVFAASLSKVTRVRPHIHKEEGRQEGENLLATLINKLISLGRNEDITKVTTDQAFRENLYIQFGLKKSM